MRGGFLWPVAATYLYCPAEGRSTETSEMTTPGWATRPITRIGDDSSEDLHRLSAQGCSWKDRASVGRIGRQLGGKVGS